MLYQLSYRVGVTMQSAAVYIDALALSRRAIVGAFWRSVTESVQTRQKRKESRTGFEPVALRLKV